MNIKNITVNILFASIGFCLAVFCIEILLRISARDEYYIWQPETFKSFTGSDVMPGVYGDSSFYINKQGVRGELLDSSFDFRILAIGGSTTECLYLDENEAWPFLLQQKLNQLQSNKKVWVGNIGGSGKNTRHHVLAAQKLLPQFIRMDLVLVMSGINDLLASINNENKNRVYSPYLDDYEKLFIAESFFIKNPVITNNLWYEPVQIKQLFKESSKMLKQSELPHFLDQAAGAGWHYPEARRARQFSGIFLDTLPDLTKHLKEYKLNLRKISELTREFGSIPIFITQTAMWQNKMEPELEKLLWMGAANNWTQYFTPKILNKALSLYNESLLSFCSAENERCIDITQLLSKDTKTFYDDAHFNEFGAKKLSSILALELINDIDQ